MNIDVRIQARIKADVAKYVALAEKHFGRSYRTPEIRYDVRGTTAGYAQGDSLVRFNPILLLENKEDFIARTVPHEVAHCIDSANGDNQVKSWSMFSRRAKRSVHGPSWQRIMAIFGVEDSTRCHSYDVSNAQVKTKAKFEYKCACCSKSYFVSSVLHNRMNRGQQRWCRVGGRERGRLTYVGGLGKVDYKTAREISVRRAANAATPAFVIKPSTPVNIMNMIPKEPVKMHVGLAVAKAIMMKANYQLTRQEFISQAVRAGMKATTASTYYNQLKKG